MTYKEFEIVKTLVDKDYTPANSVGTIIHIFSKPKVAYMVEFTDSNGETLDDPIYLPEEIVSISGDK
jgi:hypothetical protein